jgi:hypothetical protein
MIGNIQLGKYYNLAFFPVKALLRTLGRKQEKASEWEKQ